MRDAFIAELLEMAERDPSIMLITGDLGFGVLNAYIERFPRQFLNAGVAEQNMTGLAAGLALEGHKVYTYSIGNFTTLRCLEQLRNDVCYHDADVTAVAVGGGFSYGQLGMSHFATEDLAILRALPNMTVVAPSDPWETRVLTRQMAAAPGPKYLRLDKGKAGLTPDESDVTLGKVRTIRDGAALTIVTVGAILSEALKAADALAGQGIDARVLSVHTLKPLDPAPLVAAARETGAIVCIEEHSTVGGLAGAVAQLCLEQGAAPKAFRAVGLADLYPTIVGDQNYLRSAYGMDAAAIAAACRAAIEVAA
ncbi:MAG: transketolase [Deltaproteobacteria bacterium HGW-Deltaproteobacteria-17]|jgi:transketolase|nr:MAG: transketolase [Deltaproteobacteria bacterium HGW-Deltaproteobacteria-17]